MSIFGLSQMAWADEVYEMDVNNWTSASHHYTKNVWDPWTKMVEEKTDGRVKVHVHQGSALGKSTTVYQDVRGGVMCHGGHDALYLLYGGEPAVLSACNRRY